MEHVSALDHARHIEVALLLAQKASTSNHCFCHEHNRAIVVASSCDFDEFYDALAWTMRDLDVGKHTGISQDVGHAQPKTSVTAREQFRPLTNTPKSAQGQARLTSYIHHGAIYKQSCHVGNKPCDCKLFFFFARCRLRRKPGRLQVFRQEADSVVILARAILAQELSSSTLLFFPGFVPHSPYLFFSVFSFLVACFAAELFGSPADGANKGPQLSEFTGIQQQCATRGHRSAEGPKSGTVGSASHPAE